MRYAHRHDAPGCSNAQNEVVELTEESISLEVLCVQAQSKIKY